MCVFFPSERTPTNPAEFEESEDATFNLSGILVFALFISLTLVVLDPLQLVFVELGRRFKGREEKRVFESK